MFNAVKEIAVTLRVIWADSAYLLKDWRLRRDKAARIKRSTSAVDRLRKRDTDSTGGS